MKNAMKRAKIRNHFRQMIAADGAKRFTYGRITHEALQFKPFICRLFYTDLRIPVMSMEDIAFWIGLDLIEVEEALR